MPPGYYFGLTAASAELADSFEINKFTLSTTQGVTREEPGRMQPPPPQQPVTNAPSDTPASQIVDHSAQFEDLHNRLQTMAHQLDSLLTEIKGLADKSEGRHSELSRNGISSDKFNAMDKRLDGIETTIRSYQGQFSSLQNTLKDSHSSLTENLPKHMSDSMAIRPFTCYDRC